MSDIAYMYIPRISIPGFPVRGKKKYLNPQELEKVLDGEIRIEEKLDGKLTRIYSDPLPVISFAWFGEDLHYKHNIFYNKIPLSRTPFIIGIDVFSEAENKYVESRDSFFKIGDALPPFATAPVLLSGNNLKLSDILPLLESKSAFGDEQIEGIVIKNYSSQIFGKIVNPKFDNDVDDSDHWLRKKRISNRINKE